MILKLELMVIVFMIINHLKITFFFKKYKVKWIEQPFLKEKHNEIVASFKTKGYSPYGR